MYHLSRFFNSLTKNGANSFHEVCLAYVLMVLSTVAGKYQRQNQTWGGDGGQKVTLLFNLDKWFYILAPKLDDRKCVLPLHLMAYYYIHLNNVIVVDLDRSSSHGKFH